MAASSQVVVIGASLAGLFAAAAAGGTGRQVTVLERDDLPDDVRARRGVPQSEQVHVFLHRGLLAAEELLPGVRADLVRAGAVPIDTGDLPWLGEHGWFPVGRPAYEILSATRPLVEHVVRRRVLALPDVTIVSGRRVTGLRRVGSGWSVQAEGGDDLDADLVVDASGRGSRLPAWLAALGVPASRTTEIDARLGYATRRYTMPDVADDTIASPGVVLQANPQTPAGGMAIRVEDGDWLVLAVGVGEHRPPRDRDGFTAFLTGLRDPVLADLVARFRPIGDAQAYRQTGNLRRHYDTVRDWPDGLVVVGDALCAFNPVYGQGISVAACEAVLLRQALDGGPPAVGDTRRLLRRFASVLELPWAVATGEDMRYPSSGARQDLRQRLLVAWSRQLGLLAVHGNGRAQDTMSRVYHLMGSPAEMFHPALLAAALRARVRGYPEVVARPGAVVALGGT